jgi:hypothetical protein
VSGGVSGGSGEGSEEVSAYAVGDWVSISSLQKRPEMNGKVGKVTSYDSDRSRYHVLLQGRLLSVHPRNLRVCDPPSDEPPRAGERGLYCRASTKTGKRILSALKYLDPESTCAPKKKAVIRLRIT